MTDKANDTFYESPTLIVEVLSSSTEIVDRNQKFQEYIEIQTLQEYVLVSSDRIQIECFRRGEGRMRLYFSYKDGDVVEIESMRLSIPIEQLYQNVRFATTDAVEA